MTTPTQPTPAQTAPATLKHPPLLIGVVGIPGSGKSHFARSARSLGKTAIATPDPKEVTFYGGGDAALFWDSEWRPHVESYAATGMTELLKWVDARQRDDSRYIVIDPMSEVSDLAMHEVLKLHSTDNPGDLSHGKAYTAHDGQMKTLITELRRLKVRGKTVICTFHGQMKELEGQGDAKKVKAMESTRDNPKMEWEFEEQMLPVLNSSYRQRIHSAFDMWLYTKPAGFGAGRKFQLTAIPDATRPAKHSVTFKPNVTPLQLSTLDNDLGKLLALLA